MKTLGPPRALWLAAALFLVSIVTSAGLLASRYNQWRTASSSPEIAERFGNRLIDRALTLATLPERGRVVPEFGDPEIREIFFKTYRIVYRLRSGVVEVIRFWHAARGTPEIDSDEFR